MTTPITRSPITRTPITRTPASHPAARPTTGTSATGPARPAVAEPSRSAPRSGHPAAVFSALVVLVAWPLMAIPILMGRGVLPGGELLGGSVLTVERAAVLLAMAAIFGSAVIYTKRRSGTAGVRDLRQRMTRWRIGVPRWALVTLALPGLTIGLAMASGRSITTDGLLRTLAIEIGAVLLAVAVVNLWEESVWAGVVQTELEHHHNMATAALLTAVPFALVHAPLHFIEPDATLAGAAAGLALLVVLGFLVRLLVGLVLRAVADSLLAVGVFHAVFNTTNNSEGLGASLLGPDRDGFAFLAVLVLLAALAIGLGVRHRLGRR